jgi:FixJ family two-component response regulator
MLQYIKDEISGLQHLGVELLDMNTATAPGSEPRYCRMIAAKPRPARIPAPIVYVVDDDVSVRESLEALIALAGWRCELFASAESFLAKDREEAPSCLVLDLSLPDLNGLEVQRRLADQPALPIIFVTGHGDIPMSVRAMKAGALEFLTKPYGPEILLSAIQDSLERSRTALAQEADLQTLRRRYAGMTPRERQVMGLVVRGQLNKQVGGALGISEITVKAHRGRVMQKMEATSLAELVNMAARLGMQTAGDTGERQPANGFGV